MLTMQTPVRHLLSLTSNLSHCSNTVPQRQRIYQSDSRPVFQRLPRSRLYLGKSCVCCSMQQSKTHGMLCIVRQASPWLSLPSARLVSWEDYGTQLM